MTVQGANLIAGRDAVAGPAEIASRDPRSGNEHAPAAHAATTAEVDAACAAAADAADWHASASPTDRQRLLVAVADAIDDRGPDIVTTADRETGLGRDRLEGELARTTGQLRFMGDVTLDGHHLGAAIDPDEDVRRINVPLGPVAVFSASNFPLAFSVAGGDTASALAAGCPVVVKAHPSHPHTSEVTARAVATGLEQAGAPAGSFSLIHGFDAGRRLVLDPRIRAVGFTGSFRGGTALIELARDRDVPIPVHAEMGSVNPVVLTPDAVAARSDSILDGYVESLAMGVGQFCTNPGLLFVAAEDLDTVRAGVAERLADADPAPMLNQGIRSAWADTTAEWAATDGVDVVHDGSADADELQGRPTVLVTTAARWREATHLHQECFGPTSLIVSYADDDDLVAALESLEGSLTGAVHATPDGHERTRRILSALEPRVGRLIMDGWPTGVAVTWAMHHGGPYPATGDPRHTSVGAAAIRRFQRPVCYQGLPDALLPQGLQDDNPWEIPRRWDGRLTG